MRTFLLAILTLSATNMCFALDPADTSKQPVTKSQMSKQIVAELGVEEHIKESEKQAQANLQRPPTISDPAALAAFKSAQATALTNFKNKKDDVRQKALQSVSDRLESLFSEAELKYLATICKYQIIVKLINFVISPEFQGALESPHMLGTSELREAKKNSQPPVKATGKAPAPVKN